MTSIRSIILLTLCSGFLFFGCIQSVKNNVANRGELAFVFDDPLTIRFSLADLSSVEDRLEVLKQLMLSLEAANPDIVSRHYETEGRVSVNVTVGTRRMCVIFSVLYDSISSPKNVQLISWTATGLANGTYAAQARRKATDLLDEKVKQLLPSLVI